MIFPCSDTDQNSLYEVLIRKANILFDEFTTGKKPEKIKTKGKHAQRHHYQSGKDIVKEAAQTRPAAAEVRPVLGENSVLSKSKTTTKPPVLDGRNAHQNSSQALFRSTNAATQ